VAAHLIERGAHLEFADDTLGWTALIWAAKDGRSAIVHRLLGGGAEVDRMDHKRNTALMWAAKGGHVESVNALLEAGANAQLTNQTSQSALDLAKANGHDAVVRLLNSR